MYRLGIDIGTNSLGSALIKLDGSNTPCGLMGLGVRIFPDGRDPQKGTSLAADRRIARGLRRRRDRYLLRRTDLMNALVKHGLMPSEPIARKDLERLDPYELRARALDEALPLHHVGRALFHLHQRRGFKSNRKTDKTNKEEGLIRKATTRLEHAMKTENARTLGEFLAHRHATRAPVRARLNGSGKDAYYDFYPTRALVDAEFNAIWSAQALHHNELTDDARDAIHHVMFRQRDLRPQIPGKCTLDPALSNDNEGGFRAPWALPIAQTFRILQEVRNLEVMLPGQRWQTLTRADQDRLIKELHAKNGLSFDRIRTILGLPHTARFNLESERRTELKGDETAKVLAHKGRFGPRWRTFSAEQQAEIVKRLLSAEDEITLTDWLVEETGVTRDKAAVIAGAPLPERHCRLGLRALSTLVPLMRDEVLKYHEAAERVYGSHTVTPTGEQFDRLPYYGKVLAQHVSGTGDPDHCDEMNYGRLPNPTVHIGLNQLRRLINKIIKAYGAPESIVVELARDLKLSAAQKNEVDKEQAVNQKRNEDRAGKFREIFNLDPSPEDLRRMRQWEELNLKDPLDRRCPYSDEVISIERLFSAEVDVDHIIPFSACWDDSFANKTVCMSFTNKAKTNQTPFEAFGSSPTINGFDYDWDSIGARAQNLPGNKSWRFAPDARERFEAQGGFLARQLTDTAYLARLTKEYLSFVCDPNRVWVIPGRLTGLVRRKWGLNALLRGHNIEAEREETITKSRDDHRHHAIDAFVTALTDRGLLQRISRASEDERERIDVPEPWEGFRDQLRAKLNSLIVSHKLDHGVQGRLHEDTAYGFVRDPEAAEGHNLVHRKPFSCLNENEVERIRDAKLRSDLRDYLYEAKTGGISHKDAMAAYAQEHGIRRVRLLKKEKPDYLVPIRDQYGNPYKAYSAGDNLYVEIFETPDGTWAGKGVTIFEANQKRSRPYWRERHPDAKLIMRVYKGDFLRLSNNGQNQIMKVYRLDVAANRFKLADHAEAGNLDKRHNDPTDPFRWLMVSYSTLKRMSAEPVHIGIDGAVQIVRPT